MKRILLTFLLVGCTGSNWTMPDEFTYKPIRTNEYTIASWQKLNRPNSDTIHIYIEGDGHAFDAYGQPTTDPTPRSGFMRDMAAHDESPNVVYMARPCQFIMDENCSESDWTSGRFSQRIVDSMKSAIKQTAKDKNITIVGYSGGAMISGLVIKQNKDLNFEKWITIAGVLNHKTWTEYFGDEPLTESIDMEKLPKITQVHYIGERDKIVPYKLAHTWADESDLIIVPNATHDNFKDLKLFD